MVLQRDKPVPVWGWAAPDEEVTVQFAGVTVKAKADPHRKWLVQLPPLSVCSKNRTLIVRGGKNTLAVKNVLVGEVWLASGQSNMELPLCGDNPRYRDRQGAMVAQVTFLPHIRFANISTYRWQVKPQERTTREVVWQEVNPQSLKTGGLSAVAFYYALELHYALQIPIGIIDGHWAGTCIDPWTPKEGLQTRPDLRDILEYPVSTNFTKEMRSYLFNAPHQQPTVLYNEMFAPLEPYALRGMIWYQGCHNSTEWERYCSKMHALYNGFSKNFRNPDFKLYFVQLAPWGYRHIAMIQQAQAQFVQEQKNAGMAVINDLGNLHDVHPNEKELVAKRLALHAFKDLYGMKDIVADSPILSEYRIENKKFILTFKNAESWYVYHPDRSLKVGFEIAGRDGNFLPAVLENVDKNGVVKGSSLVVSARNIAEPKALRYLYTRPWFGALYNQVCLPLGAFHIDVRKKNVFP